MSTIGMNQKRDVALHFGWGMASFLGSPSILGIAEFIVPTGSFFHAQTHVSFHIIEELSPKVRMIQYQSQWSFLRRFLATSAEIAYNIAKQSVLEQVSMAATSESSH